jgi:hypothetical protein
MPTKDFFLNVIACPCSLLLLPIPIYHMQETPLLLYDRHVIKLHFSRLEPCDLYIVKLHHSILRPLDQYIIKLPTFSVVRHNVKLQDHPDYT